MPTGLEAPDSIDVVARKDGVYVLVMLVDSPWRDDAESVELLRRKVNTYATYVLDELFLRDYPDAAGQPVEVHVRSGSPPPTRAAQLLEVAAGRFAEYGVPLRLVVTP